ncbi:MAG: cell division protein FtsA [Rickettsiales bacterium]|nr:MAG: cell division protein FtsA [Rickettsiales bacterium]
MKRSTSNFIAFDVGSSKISAVASHINKQGVAAINAQILQRSEGFRSGLITNMELAESSIISAIYALEKDCDKSIKEVAISLSGAGVKSYYITHSTKIGNHPISNQDVKKLINKTLTDFKVKDKEIIHYFPVQFRINDSQEVENPVGLFAKELSCSLHIITADSLMIMNLVKCFAKCHVEISDIIVSIYAAGIATLTNDEMQLGTIIIDIGANTTSFAIFLKGKIVYLSNIPIGSSDITHNIAKTFSLTLDQAEKLKILYGNTNLSMMIKDSVIKIDDGEKTITTSELIKVISPIIKDIFIQIKKHCDAIPISKMLSQQIVITGGGVALNGIKSLASEIFQKQIRIAKSDDFYGFNDTFNPYSQSTLIGMIKSKTLLFQKNNFKSDNYDGANWLKRTLLWLKENI